MRLSDLHIGVSPLTDTIYIGTVSKKDAGCWNSKHDVTSKFIGALMDWTPPGTVRLVCDSHGNEYEIVVRKRDKASNGEVRGASRLAGEASRSTTELEGGD